MQDELYFLGKDKEFYAGKASAAEPVAEEVAVEEVATAVMAEPVVTPAPPVEEIKPPTEIKYLGTNKRAFALVVHYSAEEFINQNHLASLESILKRKGF